MKCSEMKCPFLDFCLRSQQSLSFRLMTSFLFSYEQKTEILSPTSLLECCNPQKDLMNIEHSKNFGKKTNIRKTFHRNDFHNIFELATGTNKTENHFQR